MCDGVLRSWLQHVLQSKGGFERLMACIHVIMSDRTTTLVLMDMKTAGASIVTGILQESLLLSILYLFYAAELLELCNNLGDKISTMSFMTDTNMLAYSKCTEKNCCILAQAHDCCLD